MDGSEYFPFLRAERLFVPTDESIEDRTQSFYGQISREIKRKLWSGHREDPEIRIDINVDHDVFMRGLGNIPGFMERGRMVFRVEKNRVLDLLFGQKWDERILNLNGDFAYVMERNCKILAWQKKSHYRV